MASVVHNTAKHWLVGICFRAETFPGASGFKMYLFDNGGSSAAADIDLDSYSAITGAGAAEATGGGYGEATVERSSTGFDVWDGPDDTNDRGRVQIKDVAFTASGSSIISIYYGVLMDDDATENDRVPFAAFDLSGPLTVTDGSTLTIKDAEIQINNS